MKFYRNFKKIIQIVFCISIMALVGYSTIYYAGCYLRDSQLIFTSKDRLLLFSIFALIFILIIIVCVLLVKFIRLESQMKQIISDISSVEDNLVGLQRTTQEIIMELSKRLGVGNFEKKL